MVKRFVGAGATVVLAAIRKQDNRVTLFTSFRQIVRGAQDGIVQRGHRPGAQTESPGRKITAWREILHLLNLNIKVVNCRDVLVAQTIEEANRGCTSETETSFHAARRVQQDSRGERSFFGRESIDLLFRSVLEDLKVCPLQT